MARRSLAEKLEEALRGYPSVTRVVKVGRRPAKGKRKVKIESNADHVLFSVIEPDFPRTDLRADTTNVKSVVFNAIRHLQREGVRVE